MSASTNNNNKNAHHVGSYDPSSIRKYSFKSHEIPRLMANDPEILNRMKAAVCLMSLFNSRLFYLCLDAVT